jgi:hypothetical protein
MPLIHLPTADLGGLLNLPIHFRQPFVRLRRPKRHRMNIEMMCVGRWAFECNIVDAFGLFADNHAPENAM